MTKKKKVQPLPPEADILIGPDGEKYEEYLKKHQKELRRVQREASGHNMESPPDGDY